MTNSKRFWFSMIVFTLSLISFILLVIKQSEPYAVASGLAILATPLYIYLIGETVRPSGKGLFGNTKNTEPNEKK